ncbi:MAG TPA: aminotransferase class V-fold PLP-dependent enzyme [Vicinamibacterales bacterium]|nr:aminotransferase class V-fold PLP-dependent enzyme [Vicinamibacterales bacterium]
MRSSPAELSPNDFRAAGHALVDRVADFLSTLRDLPTAPDTTPAAVRAKIRADEGVPRHGAPALEVMERAAELVLEGSTLNGHPRFFGYITSSAAPIGALADLLAATVNPNCGAWSLSPVATEIEKQSLRWIAELIGFPTDCGGILVSGGNVANITCFIAATRAKSRRDLRALGVDKSDRLVVYASAEVHTWIQKAVDICGLGLDALRSIPVNEAREMRTDALRAQIEQDRREGLHPAVIIGTAGSVGTGAIDPLNELAAIAREFDLWFHVDGAYGAPAAVLEDAPTELRAIELADSVAVDPHKWFYAPLEAGCALVRRPSELHDAFVFHPPYYRFEGAAEDPPTNFHEWGPQNSRGFRALKVWTTIQQVGRDGYRQMIADDIALSHDMHRLAAAEPELETFTQSLSISTFRYIPADLERTAEGASQYLNDLNTALLSRIQAEGTAYLSNAVLDGAFALRACIVNFRTTSADVRTTIDTILRLGRAVDSELRPDSLRGPIVSGTSGVPSAAP